MKRNFRVGFYLRSYKTKDGKCPVLIRLYLNKERIILGSAGVTVDEKIWDNTKGRAKGRSVDVAKINKDLDKIEADLMYLFHRFEYDENLSLDFIKSQYIGTENNKDSFLTFFAEYLATIKEEVGITRAMASVEKFTVLKKRFETFIKKRYRRSDLLMGEMTYRVISEFEHFLLTDGKCCHNTVMRMLRNFKTVVDVLGQRINGSNVVGKLDNVSLESYLRTHVAFLGTKQERFWLLNSNGTPDYVYETRDGKQVRRVNEVRPMALVFDYELLQEHYELNLETETRGENELSEDDLEQKPQPPAAEPKSAPTLFSEPDKENDELPF